MRRLRLWPSLALVLAAALAAGCNGALDPRPVPSPGPPAPSPTPRALSFPAAEGAHDDRMEWWYYNGHLFDVDGNEYGFHFVIFQTRAPESVSGPAYAAQLGITDVTAGRHFQGARFSVGEQPQPEDAVALNVAGWDLAGSPEGHEFQAAEGDFGLSLDMTPVKPPVPHNEIGWLTGFTPGWTYYYSWTRMAADGVLILDGREIPVTGESWMDHQWGDFFVLGHPAGWQWFALQLDDGTDIMVTESRGADGDIEALYGTIVSEDGTVTHVPHGEASLQLEVTGTWTSPHTGADYPHGWRIVMPEHGVDLELFPLLQDQEVTSTRPEAAIYWEGKVRAAGVVNREPVGGNGYAELAGYVVPPPLPWRLRPGE